MRPAARRSLACAALVAASGLLAGCQGAAAPSTAKLHAQTVATVSTTAAASKAASKAAGTPASKAAGTPASKAKVPSTLRICGAARDPFDPSAAPPPSGSPALC